MSSVTSKSTSIWVPVDLKDRIKKLSERYGKPQWKILLDALSLYETQLRKPRAKEELPVIDKITWYIEKLCMSIGALKENPSEDNLAKTSKTIAQIRERLGVDTSLLERAVGDYVKLVNKKTNDAIEKHRDLDEATMELNMALKTTLIEIIYRYVLKEDESKEKTTS